MLNLELLFSGGNGVRFTCKKNALIFLGLFSILPALYLWEYSQAINLRHLGAIVLIILCCINAACNNYQLMISEKEIALERLIGMSLKVNMESIYKIEMREKENNTELVLYTRQNIYLFSIRCLDDKKINAYLQEIASKLHIDYQRNVNWE